MAEQGAEVKLFDHTINDIPCKHDQFEFFKCGLAGKDTEGMISLPTAVTKFAADRDIILKMDIEGAEWDVLDNCPEKLLTQFKQIIFELHNFTDMYEANCAEQKKRCLRKLNISHVPVHIHMYVFGLTIFCGFGNKPQLHQ